MWRWQVRQGARWEGKDNGTCHHIMCDSSNKIEIESTPGIRHGGIHNLCEHLTQKLCFSHTLCSNLMPLVNSTQFFICENKSSHRVYTDKIPKKDDVLCSFHCSTDFLSYSFVVRKLRWVRSTPRKLKELKFQRNRLFIAEMLSVRLDLDVYLHRISKMKRLDLEKGRKFNE